MKNLITLCKYQKMISKCPKRFSMKSVAVFIALFHASLVVATVPNCKPFDSHNLSPSALEEEAPSPEPDQLPPVPPPEAPDQAPIAPDQAPEDGVFDVTDHGAVPDGDTESSSAFSAAWNAACEHPNHSTFYIPKGTFLVGPISFPGPCHNNRSPDIDIRGTLLAPASLNAFETSNWITLKNLQGFTLTGGTGTAKLDGQGAAEAWKQQSCEKSDRCDKLITSIGFFNVSHANISGITLSNGKGFHLGLHGSSDINIYKVNITAPEDSPNTDGIHVSHSSNVNIFSSNIGVGDDCVSIGPGTNNISITEVHCGPGHGISVGSLGKYKKEKDVVGIRVQNCTIKGTQNGVRVKTWPGSLASKASNLTFEDIIMINVSNPIIIDQDYCPSNSCKTNEPSHVKLKDIFIRNINGSYNTKYAVTLLCSADVPCENVQLVNISLNHVLPDSTPREGRLSMNGYLNDLKLINSRF